MPLTLITGKPGHGKSLRALWMMRELRKKNSDRPIYASNISGLDHDAVGVVNWEDPQAWMEMEPGSALFVDEAQHFFRARPPSKPIPEHVKALEEHRHSGTDIYLITQHGTFLDTHIRKLCERHYNVKRAAGIGRCTIREFDEYTSNPSDPKTTSISTKNWRYDKSLFNLYKSAEVHTIKAKIPLKLVGAIMVLLFAVCAIGYTIFWAFGLSKDQVNSNVETIQSSAGVNTSSNNTRSSGRAQSASSNLVDLEFYHNRLASQRAEYRLNNEPMLNRNIWTSHFYSDVYKAATYPKPHCALMPSVNKCICHTQQGTTMNIDFNTCEYIAINGFFDPTKEEPETDELGGSGLTQSVSAPPAFFEPIERPSRGIVFGQGGTRIPPALSDRNN